MTVHDLWYSDEKDPKTNERRKTKRHGRGNRWRVSWEDPETSKIVTRSFDRKADAENFDKNIGADISRGQYVDPRAGQITVAEYFASWFEGQMFREQTERRVESNARVHFLPFFGNTPISSVRASQIQRWVRDRSQILGPKTLHVTYGTVVAPLFKAAVIDRIIGVSPCSGITLPRIQKAEYYIASRSEVLALSAALPDRYRAIPLVAAGCGWRAGEIFGAEVDAFDFLRREAHVRRGLISARGGPKLAPPKTSTSKRTNGLPTITAEALALHMQKYPPRSVLIKDISTDPRSPIERHAKLMFTTSRGSAISSSTWQHAITRAAAEVGLPADFGLHDLRHYFATALIWGGANVKEVQLAMGHSTPTTTLNIYTGYWPDAEDRTRHLIDEALSPVDKGRRTSGS
jgi:integrase